MISLKGGDKKGRDLNLSKLWESLILKGGQLRSVTCNFSRKETYNEV